MPIIAAGMTLLSRIAAGAAADAVPPTLIITAPAAGVTVPAAGTLFSGTASDNAAVSRVRIYVYDEARSRFTVSNAIAAYTAATGQWSFDVLAAHISPGGTARLWAQAQDTSGNISPWQNRAVQVTGVLAMPDTTAPTVVIATPLPSAAVPAAGASFSGTAADAAGVAKVRIYVFDLTRQLYTVNNAPADLVPSTGAWAFPVSANQITAGGSARLWVQAEDGAGNRSPWQSQLISVQNGILSGFSRVQVSGGQLMVEKRKTDGTLAAAAPMKLRGVAYSPVDWGETVNTLADARLHLRESQYAADFALMQQLGANAIKTYADAGTDAAAISLLDEAYARGLMVAVTLDIDSAQVQSVVAAYKDHPALLCWIIGNEWNLNGFFRNLTLTQATAQVNAIAQQIHTLDPNHPVASSLGFLPAHFNMGPDIVNREFPAIINGALAVDFWALNVYRSDSFDPIFLEWSLLTSKPFFFGEFGTDDWNAQAGLDEWAQADTAFNLWDEIHRQVSINRPSRQCLGGFVFAWSDEWWKMGNPTLQDSSGFAVEREIVHSQTAASLATFRGHPDGMVNEEHFGIVTLSRQAKQVFWVLREAFGLGSLRTEGVAVNVRAAGNGPSGYVVFTKRGLPLYTSEAAGVYLMTIARNTGSVLSLRRFNVASSPQTECTALLSAVQSMAAGDIAALGISQNALPAGSSFASSALSSCAAAFGILSAQQALQIQPQQPWALIAAAGAPASNIAEASGSVSQPVDITAVVVLDADRDGISDRLDSDNDNDGVSDSLERVRGTDILDLSS